MRGQELIKREQEGQFCPEIDALQSQRLQKRKSLHL